MLVMTRRNEERVFIGDKITLVIMQCREGEVRFGIEAPNDIPILRDDAKRGVSPLAAHLKTARIAGRIEGEPGKRK